MAAGSVCAHEISDARAKLYGHYSAALARLADSLEHEGLSEPAGRVRAWLPEHPTCTITLFALPERAEWSAPDSPAWLARFRELREIQAEALMKLARDAVAAGRGSLAMELVLEAAHENPDHKDARRLLGYVHMPAGGDWRRPFAIRQYGAGKIWDSRFGWIPKAHLANYQQGKRYFQNRWISDEEDRRRHAGIDNGWLIETANYRITTNHSLEEGVRLAERLERFHDFWEVLCIGYLEKPERLAARFAGKGTPPTDAQKHDVVYFRDREQYIRLLLPTQPQIGITLGLYSDRQRTSYFFAGEEQQGGMLYHEATHQLFQEARKADPNVGHRNNIWVAEGIACYFESLTEHETGRFTLGGATAGRLPVARQRLLVDQIYTPLAELVGYGLDRLQGDPNIPKLYTESAGLATFFMHYDSGRYRPALFAYLQAVYGGVAGEDTLSQKTGASYPELDRQYREFLSAL